MDRGTTPVHFFINFGEVMKASFHERFITLVMGAVVAYLFIKTLFF